jgi:carbonic anhydrase/acetyltransferase-like protein (isoleucine patch superfamily)
MVLAGPPRSSFGAFGSAFLVPPIRVDNPDCVFIGDRVIVHEGVWLSVASTPGQPPPRLEIHDRVSIGRFCQVSCAGLIVIAQDVLISDQVQIGDTYHDYAAGDLTATAQPLSTPQPVRIETGALIGLGAIILPGVVVGAGAYVTEGSLVTTSVAPRSRVSGNPARPV